MLFKNKYYLFGTMLIFISSTCKIEAPHDNPLDPLSPAYNPNGSIVGTVTIKEKPQSSITGASITALPYKYSTQTDTLGKYSISNIPQGSVKICCNTKGYSPESSFVKIEVGQQTTVNFSLNGLPIISNTRILTRKTDQLWPSAIYYAQVQASVSDPNGMTDIDSVWFSVDEVTIPMTYSVNRKVFEADIFSYDTPIKTLEWLVGRPLYINAIDRYGSISTSTSFYVSRIIEAQAVPKKPTAGDTVSGLLLMEWETPQVTFNYTYSLNIVRIQSGNQIVVWSKDLLASYLRSYQYTGTLQSGNYFWTITIVDEFGNWSRSKESIFIIL